MLRFLEYEGQRGISDEEVAAEQNIDLKEDEKEEASAETKEENAQ